MEESHDHGASNFAFNSMPMEIADELPMSKRQRNRENIKARKIFKDELHKFTRSLCDHLKEPKIHAVKIAVELLGTKMMTELVKEVDAVESNGGQMTADGTRRRTPGGVLFNIMKSRLEPSLYKKIMSDSDNYQKSRVSEMKGYKRMRVSNDNSENKQYKRRKVDYRETLHNNDLDACASTMPSVDGHVRTTVDYGDLLE